MNDQRRTALCHPVRRRRGARPQKIIPYLFGEPQKLLRAKPNNPLFTFSGIGRISDQQRERETPSFLHCREERDCCELGTSLRWVRVAHQHAIISEPSGGPPKLLRVQSATSPD